MLLFPIVNCATLGPVRQNAGCHQLTKSEDWLFFNSHKVMGIKHSPGSHRKSGMSASPFSLEEGSVTFSERRDCCYLSALNGDARVAAKWEGYSPPGVWRCSCNVILKSGPAGEIWRTISRAGKWRQSLKTRGRLAEERAWALAVDGPGLYSQPPLWLVCDLRHIS